MIGFKYIIKDNGEYKSQTHIGSRSIPEANGFAHWGQKSGFRTFPSSAVNPTTTGQTDQKSDYEPLRLKFPRKY